MGGVVSQQLSFSLPAKEYTDSGELYGAGSVTTLSCSNGADFPVFYVISRSFSGDKLNMVCYDKTYTVDRKVPVTENSFDEEGYISLSTLMSLICSVCGFEGYSDSTASLKKIEKAHRDNVLDCSCRNVLDDLSAVCGGCWIVSGDTGNTGRPSGILVLAAPDKYTSSTIIPEKHSDVQLGGTHRFSSIALTSGDKTYTAGDEQTPYNSYETDTPYATAQAAGDLYGRLREYVYRGWECEKLLCGSYPAPPALVTFGDKQLTANHCTLNLMASGMYASIGANAVTEDGGEYLNRTTREMRRRYRLGDIMNNVSISKGGGVEFVFKNGNSGKTEKYGFTVNESGTVKFDGVMMDSRYPSKIENIGETSKAIYYGDKKYLLSWEIDSEGNKVNFKTEEADE
ncbi:MAG: hypothetical protein NC078_04700 [Ruminococcus sp.]|nr:hypothetical protein [Ruminococcus sp.]